MNTAQVSYERDFYAWVNQQALLLKQHRFGEVDLANLIEEVETLGRSEQRSLNSRLEVLMQHLLKWQFQPEKNGTSWHTTIIEQRERIAELLEDSPSLKPRLQDEQLLQKLWTVAVKKASSEAGIAKTDFPTSPIWSIEDILDENFYPDSEG